MSYVFKCALINDIHLNMRSIMMDKKDIVPIGSVTRRVLANFIDELKTDNEASPRTTEQKNSASLFSGKLSTSITKAENIINKESSNDNEKIVLSDDDTRRLKSINNE